MSTDTAVGSLRTQVAAHGCVEIHVHILKELNKATAVVFVLLGQRIHVQVNTLHVNSNGRGRHDISRDTSHKCHVYKQKVR